MHHTFPKEKMSLTIESFLAHDNIYAALTRLDPLLETVDIDLKIEYMGSKKNNLIAHMCWLVQGCVRVSAGSGSVDHWNGPLAPQK